jgi:plasmid replication initiation protein
MQHQSSEVTVRKLRDGVAVMDNKLLDACYRMTLTQKRLFNMAVAAVNSVKRMPNGNTVSVSIDDFAQLCGGLSRKDALKRCREAVPSMSQAQIIDIIYKDPNEFLQDMDTNNIERLSYKNFFQEVDYIETDKDQVVRFKFSDWLIPYIAQLKKSFTQIRLQHVNPLTSFYSMRLYEAVIMRMLDSNGVHTRTFEIQELRMLMGVDDDKYNRWVDFKKRCLVSPIADLNEKTPYTWVIKTNGRGKYLKSVTITAEPNHQQELEL